MNAADLLDVIRTARKISSVKSLFGFGHRLGYLPFDAGRLVKRPKFKDTLAERILSEGDVRRLFLTADQLSSYKCTPLQEVRRLVCRRCRSRSRRAAVARVAPPRARHPCLERGAAIHLAQATLGHASVATTGRDLRARPTDSSARYLPV